MKKIIKRNLRDLSGSFISLSNSLLTKMIPFEGHLIKLKLYQFNKPCYKFCCFFSCFLSCSLFIKQHKFLILISFPVKGINTFNNYVNAGYM